MFKQALIFFSVIFFSVSCSSSSQNGQRCKIAGQCPGGSSVQDTQQSPPSNQTQVVQAALSCMAQSTKATYDHGETVGISISAAGGSGSYAVPGFVSSFSGSTTIYIGTYSNYGSNDRAVEKAVSITDSNGAIASCNFRFTVRPASPSTTGLACGITPSKFNPAVNETVTFTVTAAGGSGSYTFGQFYPRQGEAPKPLSSISGGTATVTHAYTWSGAADPAVKVTDGSGSSVWCEVPNRYLVIVPNSSPKVYASVTAATLDAAGLPTSAKDLYRVTLTTSGFSGINPIDFRFTSTADGVFSEPGVSVSQNQAWTGDSVFFIKRLDAPANHNFNIKFVAETTDGQRATTTLNVLFGDFLACDVVEPNYIFQGTEAVFNVSAFSGESVDIAEVTIPTGVGIRTATNGPIGVLGLTFPAQGLYEVRFKARSRLNPAIYCNGKADYVVNANVLPPSSGLVGCQVQTNLNPVSVNAPLRVDLVRNGGSVDLSGYIVNLTLNGLSTRDAGPYANGPQTLSYDLRLSEVKTYLLKGSMQEVSTGVKVNCESYVNVVSSPGLQAKVYDIPVKQSGGLANYPFWTYVPSLDHVVQNVNVTARRSDCCDHKHSHLRKYGNSPVCEYPGVGGRKEWFGLEYKGYIKTPVTGVYAFRFDVDDGIALEIDGVSLLWIDGLHSPQSTAAVNMYLGAGEHTIRIRYFQGPKWEVANVFYWQKPGGIWEVVPAGSFRQP